MANKTGESRTVELIKAYQVVASTSYSEKRKVRNEADAVKLEKEGYSVVRDLHPNGAYAAMIGEHKEHEINVVIIFAENGLAATLDREGNLQIRTKRGLTLTLPSSDGTVEKKSMEIAALTGKPSAEKVADAIAHSFKPFNPAKGMTFSQ